MHRRRIYERDVETCQYCGNGASSVDHLIPKLHGGQDRWENLVAACGTCNRNKGDDPYPVLADAMAELILQRRTMRQGYAPLYWQVRTLGWPLEPVPTNLRRGRWFDQTLIRLVFVEPGSARRRVRRRQDLALTRLVAAVPTFDESEARRELDRLVAEGKLGTTPQFYVDRTAA